MAALPAPSPTASVNAPETILHLLETIMNVLLSTIPPYDGKAWGIS
jgi:hypothetical protein